MFFPWIEICMLFTSAEEEMSSQVKNVPIFPIQKNPLHTLFVNLQCGFVAVFYYSAATLRLNSSCVKRRELACVVVLLWSNSDRDWDFQPSCLVAYSKTTQRTETKTSGTTTSKTQAIKPGSLNASIFFPHISSQCTLLTYSFSGVQSNLLLQPPAAYSVHHIYHFMWRLFIKPVNYSVLQTCVQSKTIHSSPHQSKYSEGCKSSKIICHSFRFSCSFLFF